MEELKIPKERIAVVVGTKGKTKRKIEKLTKTKIKIDSKEGDIIIDGKDNINNYNCKNIVKAIGRGFTPEEALQLLNENYFYDSISIESYTRKSKNALTRIKSRIIGTGGKARKQIEFLTNTCICIYGKTVGIIGEQENVGIARQAVEKLLQGSKHGPVYEFIEKSRNI
ncbi:KH domain-containing protein [archaeon]|nr:KH domain-containing protein [archaeon]